MLKQAKNSFILMAVLNMLLGVILLVWPDKFLLWGCYALGLVVLLYGISRIIAYMANKNAVSYLNVDLIAGIIVTAIGVFLLIRPNIFLSILPIVFGLFIIFSGIVKLQNAFELKRVDYEKWWRIFLVAVISVLLGILIIWNPFTTAALTAQAIGIVLIFDGFSSAWSTIFSWHKVKKLTRVLEDAAKEVVNGTCEVEQADEDEEA